MKWSPHEEGILAGSIGPKLKLYNTNTNTDSAFDEEAKAYFKNNYITSLQWDKNNKSLVISSSRI